MDSFGRNVDAPQDSQNNYYTVKAIIKHSLFAGDVTFYIVEGVATCDNFIYSKDYYDSEYYGKINPV